MKNHTMRLLGYSLNRVDGLFKTARAMFIGVLLATSLPLSVASAAMLMDSISTRAIVVFQDGTTTTEINQFLSDYAILNIEMVMQVPLINGVVVQVPSGINMISIAEDPIISTVQVTQALDVLTMQAMGEGGAGEGGAGEGGADEGGAGEGGAISYIESFPLTPSNKDRPWGVLNTFNYSYDPSLYLDSFNAKQLHPLVKEILSYTATVDIAVFDTGIDKSHKQLRNVKDGIDLVHMTPGVPTDDNGHGTHIAGTLVSSQFGLVPKARVHAVKILDQNAMGDSSTLVMALQWALDNGIEIVNMSIGFRDDNELVRLAIQNAHAQGLIMVAAVGNASNWIDDTTGTGEGGAGEGGAGEGGAGEGGAGEGGAGEGGAGEGGAGTCTDPALNCTAEGRYPVMYPARYPEVIGVAAMDPYLNLAAFSNDGPEVDVIAPGVDIVSLNLGASYGVSNGTSMATPHVTAAITLLLAGAASLGHTLSPDDIDYLLAQMNAVTGGELDLVVLAYEALSLFQTL